jgi:hypothetical protein
MSAKWWGKYNSASSAITASIKCAITKPGSKAAHEGSVPAVTRLSDYDDYHVADLVGRCILRVCFWIDVIASRVPKEESPLLFPSEILPQPEVKPIEAHEARLEATTHPLGTE